MRAAPSHHDGARPEEGNKPIQTVTGKQSSEKREGNYLGKNHLKKFRLKTRSALDSIGRQAEKNKKI